MPRSADLVGYTYDADTHCTDCAIAYYTYRAPNAGHVHTGLGALPDGLVDLDGNPPSPVYSDYSAGNWCDHDVDSPGELACGDCGEQLLVCDRCWVARDTDNGCTCETCDAFRAAR